MKKTISLLILLPLFFGIVSQTLVSQEFENINSVVRPIYSVFKTTYGVIVYYQSYAPDSPAFSAPLYIPNEWFLPPSSRKSDDTVADIYAKLSPLYKNLNAPFIEFFYIDDKIKEIKVHLTKKNLNAPLSYLPPDLRSLDSEGKLEAEFEDQKYNDIIAIY